MREYISSPPSSLFVPVVLQSILPNPPMSSDGDMNVIHDGGFRVLTGLADSEMPKRRKVSRACDICRMKKIRCDAHSEPNMEKCSYCAAHKLECTFIQGSKKRSPPNPGTTTPSPALDILYRYIEDLEERVALLEKLLRRVAPTVNIDTEVGPSFNMQTWHEVKGKSLSSHMTRAPATQIAATSRILHVLPHATSSTTASKDFQSRFSSPTQLSIRSSNSPVQEELEPSDDESHLRRSDGVGGGFLEKEMEKLSLGDIAEKKFLGKSSGVSLVRAALALKDTVAGNPRKIYDPCKYMEGRSRPKFWKPSPWEWMAAASPAIDSLRFPPPDLMRTLINRCFDDVLSLMPILHRPSFEKQYAEEKHRTDLDFARLLLIVCSVGARTIKDARVCLTSPEGDIEWNSAGWMYFAQAHLLTKPILSSAKLLDLQIMALSATYLEGAASTSGAWLINGIGVRFAEDVGAHRDMVYSSTPTFDQQMWKRTFWCLVQKDRQFSAGLGRPMCIHDDDIDLQPPLEVDDDGWDEAKQIWVQPTGKPSQLTFLVQQSKLMGILANCMRTIYCINKSKVRLGFVGAEWEQDKVSELDSALNEWQEALPDHLRWDPHMDSTFYQQAAALRITFFYIQISIHRPLIQLSSSSRRALSLPSLAVCTNAARSVAHILETTVDMPSSTMFVLASLQSGVMLMISIWEARRSGLNVDMTKHIADVHICLRYLKRWENRYHLSGRMYDILRHTASISDIPLPVSSHTSPPRATTHSQGNATKRSRDDGSPTHDSWSEISQSTMSGPSSSLAPQHATGFSDRTQPQFTAEHTAPFAGPLQYTQTSTGFTNLNNTVHATNGLDDCVLPPLPVNPWPPLSGGYVSDPLSVPESTWQSFPISGSGVSELGIGFQGFLGYDAQEPDHWNGDPKNQWNWLNEGPAISVAPFIVPRPAQ
ncbi:hypothetical protein FRB93_000987 [Tulasnella sp. JGI-2019a]|nr:hypothetical protein FRB93_000987 [Tulasnella sp. JGI-2019a]